MESVILGQAITVKVPVPVAVPPGVTTETSLAPVAADPSMLMLTAIRVSLFTMKLLTAMPKPKLTDVAPMKPVPVIVTSVVVHGLPWLGLTQEMAGAGYS